MKSRTYTNLMIRSTLAAALAIAVWSPVYGQPTATEDAKKLMPGNPMMDETMMAKCEKMKEMKEQMMAEMKAGDAALSEHVTMMNAAPDDKKVEVMAALITHMVEQQTAMHEKKAKMEQAMMKHMMEHMEMGKDSMMKCPMMKGMKGDAPDSPEEHHESEK